MGLKHREKQRKAEGVNRFMAEAQKLSNKLGCTIEFVSMETRCETMVIATPNTTSLKEAK